MYSLSYVEASSDPSIHPSNFSLAFGSEDGDGWIDQSMAAELTR
jgi:hypothetical protein